MKRRVVKVGDRRYRVELPGGDLSEFSYREKPRRWDPDQCTHLDFEPGEDRYLLSWEGLFMDSFPGEIDVLLFIIKFGYGVGDNQLVPSEILTDFNLAYEAGDWVDVWNCPDQHDVVWAMGEIQKPVIRNIRFEGYPRITPKIKAKVEGWDNDSWDQRRTVVATIEIPELDFEKLEEPRKRRRECSRAWADRSDPSYESWMYWKLDAARRRKKRDRTPDAECVFTLKSGVEAEKLVKPREKQEKALQE